MDLMAMTDIGGFFDSIPNNVGFVLRMEMISSVYFTKATPAKILQ